MSRLPPPLAERPKPERHGDCVWSCLKTDAEPDYLRSFTKKSWRPPEFRFVSYNISVINKSEPADDGDYKNKLEMSKTPNDLYARSK